MYGQPHAVRVLQNAIKGERVAHAYLFAGPRGTGKTSAARILAKALNCKKGPAPDPCNQCEICLRITSGTGLDVTEIDAASNRGIDEIRALRENARFAPSECRYKLYIIDEVHMLTPEAFNALLKTLEEPPAQTLFILATTEAGKVPHTIASRCQRLDFRRIPINEIVARLREIAAEEGIECEEDALGMVARKADGSLRDAVSLLDQVTSFGQNRVDIEGLNLLLGLAENVAVTEFMDVIAEKKPSHALELINRLYGEGKDLQSFLRAVTEHVRDILVVITCNGARHLVEKPEAAFLQISAQATKFKAAELMHALKILQEAGQEMRWNPQHRIILEMAVLALTHPAADVSLPALKQRVSELERRLNAALQGLHPGGQAQEPGEKPQAPGASGRDRGAVQEPPPKSFSPTLAEFETAWPTVLMEIKEADMPLGTYVKDCLLVNVEDGLLTLGFPPDRSAHKERVLQMKDLLSSLLGNAGWPLGVRCVNVEAPPAPAQSPDTGSEDGEESLQEAELKEAFVREFNGEVV